MYKITFKGRIDPIYVPDEKGELLKSQWLADSLPDRLEFSGRAILSSEIKAVEEGLNPEYDTSKVRDANEIIGDINREYLKWRRSQLQKSPAERAKNLNIPRLVWQSHTGEQTLPLDIAEKIIERQQKYLEENTGLVYANPICYRDLIKKTVEPNMFFNAGMRLAERICAEDKYFTV